MDSSINYSKFWTILPPIIDLKFGTKLSTALADKGSGSDGSGDSDDSDDF